MHSRNAATQLKALITSTEEIEGERLVSHRRALNTILGAGGRKKTPRRPCKKGWVRNRYTRRCRRRRKKSSSGKSRADHIKIRKTKAIYMNRKKATYFEISKVPGNKWLIHLEFPKFYIKRYVIKIEKDKFTRSSFQYKLKQRDYTKEYQDMMQELGNITPHEKLRYQKQHDREIKRIKRGVTLQFDQY